MALSQNMRRQVLFVAGLFLGVTCMDEPKCSYSKQTVTCNDLTCVPRKFPNDTAWIILNNLQAEEIPSHSFRDVELPLLRKIEIVNSRVKVIRKFAFHAFTNVTNLHLYHSRVEQIEEYAFSNIQKIDCIRIHNSSVGEIASNAFSQISGVREIAFNNNTISCIKTGAFSDVRRVAVWSFGNNYIGTIETGAFSSSSFAFLNIHANTFEHMMCGSVDVAVEAAMNQLSAGENQICCGCSVLWMLQPGTRLKLRDFLKGLKCMNTRSTVDNSPNNMYLSAMSWEDIPCDNEAERRQYNTSYCPRIPQVEVMVFGASLSSGVSISVMWCTRIGVTLTIVYFLSFIISYI